MDPTQLVSTEVVAPIAELGSESGAPTASAPVMDGGLLLSSVCPGTAAESLELGCTLNGEGTKGGCTCPDGRKKLWSGNGEPGSGSGEPGGEPGSGSGEPGSGDAGSGANGNRIAPSKGSQIEYCSSTAGNGKDNPNDPYGLTEYQAERTVMVVVGRQGS